MKNIFKKNLGKLFRIIVVDRDGLKTSYKSYEEMLKDIVAKETGEGYVKDEILNRMLKPVVFNVHRFGVTKGIGKPKGIKFNKYPLPIIYAQLLGYKCAEIFKR